MYARFPTRSGAVKLSEIPVKSDVLVHANGHVHLYLFEGKMLTAQDLTISTRSIPFEDGKTKAIAWIAEGIRNGIEMPYAKLYIRDPLMLSVMELPCRGKNCTHNSCFDLKVFLNFNLGRIKQTMASQGAITLQTPL